MAKTDFLRRMSHDIRTPINGIRGTLEIAEHFPDDTEKLKYCQIDTICSKYISLQGCANYFSKENF